MQLLLGDPHASHVDGQRALRLGRAGHELGRPATDVDDEERPVSRIEVSRRATEREASLFVARQQLGLDAHDLFRHREEVVAVRGVTGGRRRGDAHVVHTQLVHAARYSRSTTAVRSMASGASGFVAFTP